MRHATEDQDPNGEPMSRTATILILAILAAIVLAIWAVALYGQGPGPYRSSIVDVQPQDGFMPPVVLIRLGAPPDTRICAEIPMPPGPTPRGVQRVDCRTANEMRRWVQERTKR